MNELITELAEQAGLYDFVIEQMGIEEEMQKFAELILQHCFDSMHRLEQDIPNIWKVEYDIKSDFGIKL